MQDWTPQYDSWRHGGWYVTNVQYASGACGCVSRNYADGKWRIVCDDRPGSFPGGPNDHTYPNRDAAARAERVLAMESLEAVAGCFRRLHELTTWDWQHGNDRPIRRVLAHYLAGLGYDIGDDMRREYGVPADTHAALEAEWQAAFAALKAAGLEADADDPIAARYRAASDEVNHSNRKRDAAIFRGLTASERVGG